jgi:hypothetical protein
MSTAGRGYRDISPTRRPDARTKHSIAALAAKTPTKRRKTMVMINPPDPITSPHQGNRLDLIRTALMALQHYAEQETDDVELATVHKCLLALQNILATHAKNRDAAMGITPALQHTRRVAGGNY